MADEKALDAARLTSIDERLKSVQNLIGRKAYADAIKASLTSPPFATKSDEVKVLMNSLHFHSILNVACIVNLYFLFAYPV